MNEMQKTAMRAQGANEDYYRTAWRFVQDFRKQHHDASREQTEKALDRYVVDEVRSDHDFTI